MLTYYDWVLFTINFDEHDFILKACRTREQYHRFFIILQVGQLELQLVVLEEVSYVGFLQQSLYYMAWQWLGEVD